MKCEKIKTNENNDKKNAAIIGILLVSSYIVNYTLRNLLSVLTPELLETDVYTVEHIATLSSAYMFFYAFGQLVNGFLGDIISPKKLSVSGIALAGAGCMAFVFLPHKIMQIICFAVIGFALSMVRGPFMKIISENTLPNHARTNCVFFSFSSFAGPLIATFFAMLFNWKTAFIVAGVFSVAIASLSYIMLSVLERKGQITYKTSKSVGISAITDVFKIEKFIFYLVVACLVEIAGASISFWIPTYLTDFLHFQKDNANFIYSAISTARSFVPFAALVIFRLSKERDIAIMRVSFIVAFIGFAALIIPTGKWFSIGILTIALLAMSCISSILWSIYIPGLGKTGKVSSVNGVLDCAGYIAAASANMLFANAMSNIGWNGVFLFWASMGVIGFTATFFAKKKERQ